MTQPSCRSRVRWLRSCAWPGSLACVSLALALAGREPASKADTPPPGTVLGLLEHHVYCLVFSGDGSRLAVAGGRTDAVGEFSVWDVATGHLRIRSNWSGGAVERATFSPDGGRLLTASGYAGRLRWWDLSRGTVRPVALDGPGHGHAVVPAPDGRTAFRRRCGGCEFWELDTGRTRAVLRGEAVGDAPAVFSGDGRLLATGGNDSVPACLWDVASGAVVRRVPACGSGWSHAVRCLALSQDGRVAAFGTEGGTVRAWDSLIGKALLAAEHDGHVNAVALTGDGGLLASGSNDQTVHIWEVATGRELATFEALAASVSALAFSPDGRTLASGTYDGTVALWDVSSLSGQAAARGR